MGLLRNGPQAQKTRRALSRRVSDTLPGADRRWSGTCASRLRSRKSSKWRRRRYSLKDGNQGEAQ
jgi:hypothetical protein